MLKPFSHAVVSLFLSFVIFFISAEPWSSLGLWLIFGLTIGIGVDTDHIFFALMFNWKVTVEDLLSLNPLRLYNDFMSGIITGGKMSFDRQVIYSSFHLITMIIINLLVSLYFPNFTVLSLIVTFSHYLMDHIHIFQKK
jgi:hypothetical protein|tara:strand:- start:968 stop:1384 length:417 start_codon:yes stop_codon:yes gene_type:complete